MYCSMSLVVFCPGDGEVAGNGTLVPVGSQGAQGTHRPGVSGDPRGLGNPWALGDSGAFGDP